VVLEDLDDGSRTYYLEARDPLGHVSGMSNLLTVTIDTTPPEVEIAAPSNDTTVSGHVRIKGTFKDANPSLFYIEYGALYNPNWSYVVPPRSIGSERFFSEGWATDGLPDGRYQIRVTVMDAADHQHTHMVEVTLANAHLFIDPFGLSFSDPEPEYGEEMYVQLLVRNTGDADARGVMVDFYVDGELMHTTTAVDIPARSAVLVFYSSTALNGEEHSARAYSDLYETDEVSRTIVTREVDVDDEPSGDAAYFVAMLALIISLISMAVASMILRNMPRR
jgi:hypothetical protein